VPRHWSSTRSSMSGKRTWRASIPLTGCGKFTQ
jgi:hypothetical protein